MAADCVFTDQAGRLLVLEPPYKATWDMPGGVVERDESPRLSAQREVREEIGLTVEPGDLLAVDWISQSGEFTEIVAFLFDGGVLTPADIDRIVIDPTEVKSFRLATLDEAEQLLDAEQFARVAAGLRTRRSTTYLENGSPPRSTKGYSASRRSELLYDGVLRVGVVDDDVCGARWVVLHATSRPWSGLGRRWRSSAQWKSFPRLVDWRSVGSSER